MRHQKNIAWQGKNHMLGKTDEAMGQPRSKNLDAGHLSFDNLALYQTELAYIVSLSGAMTFALTTSTTFPAFFQKYDQKGLIGEAQLTGSGILFPMNTNSGASVVPAVMSA